MEARAERERRIVEVIAKHVAAEKAREEIQAIINDVISDERQEAYDNGWSGCMEVYIG